MANAAIQSMFGQNRQKAMQEAKANAQLQLKAAPGDYFARLAKVGFKTTDKKDKDGNPIVRYFHAIVILCDVQGNETNKGEQAINTIDLMDDPEDKKGERKFYADKMKRVIEAIDAFGYAFPDNAEQLDADIAELNREKPHLRINISASKDGGRKFVNVNEVVSLEMIENTIQRKLGSGESMEEVNDTELNSAIDNDEPAGEPEPGQTQSSGNRRSA